MDFKPENEFVSLSTLETYIEKYPEDAEKWFEFIKIQDESDEPRRRYHRSEINQEFKQTQKTIIEKNTDSPIDNFNDGCLYCKKSWASTEGVPKITMICGHSYHTVCYMYEQYSTDSLSCIVEGCSIDTWSYVRNIYKSNSELKKKAENILLNSYKKRPEFKQDVSKLKDCISEFQGSHNNLQRLLNTAKLNLIHKHIHSIRHYETDMNQSVKDIKTSEEHHKYTDSLKKFRKQSGIIFRKYHLSYRDLYMNKMVKTSWNLRSLLERYHKFNFYKMGIRLYPGRKPYRDVLEAEGEDEEDDNDEDEEDEDIQYEEDIHDEN